MTTRLYRKTKLLGSDDLDSIVTERVIDVEQRKMINFTVLQLYIHEGEVHQIKKHDFSHTGYNVHKYYEKLTDRTEYTDELTDQLYWTSRKDILENWQEYRNRYVKKFLQD